MGLPSAFDLVASKQEIIISPFISPTSADFENINFNGNV